MTPRCRLCVGLLILITTASAQKPSFEVASVKLNISGSQGGSMGPRGDTLVATNIMLISLLMYAYAPPGGQFLRQQIIGAPVWSTTDHFDIQAKAASDTPIEQTKAMMQSLLEDRFQLKAHRETRDLPVYNLVQIKSGPKPSPDQTPPDPRQSFINFASPGEQLEPLPRGAMRMISGPTTTLIGSAIHIARIVALLQDKSDRMIINKTGLTALLDIRLEFSQDLDINTPGESAPSLFTAIQEIGLKLEPSKAPLDALIIDSVQKPSGN